MRFRAWPTRWRASVTLPTAGGSCCRCRRHGIPGPIGAMTCAMRRMSGLRDSRCWRGKGGFEMSACVPYVVTYTETVIKEKVVYAVTASDAERIAEEEAGSGFGEILNVVLQD